MAEKNTSIREALRAALHEEMVRDDRVFIMGEEVGRWDGTHKVTRGFFAEFGERRVRDTPISEMVIAGAAVGAAMAGCSPPSANNSNQFSLPGRPSPPTHSPQNPPTLFRALHPPPCTP